MVVRYSWGGVGGGVAKEECEYKDKVSAKTKTSGVGEERIQSIHVTGQRAGGVV